MIINTGSRTDIPAFYSNWFYQRIQEEFVCVRNPFASHLVTRFTLNPKVVDALIFCTKNPQPMLPSLQKISSYRQLWHVTITPYGKDIEPQVPEKKQVIASFCELSKLIGKERVVWRYDPIFFSEKYSFAYHLRAFKTMCSLLKGHTSECVFSFIDLYGKTKKNFPEVKEVPFDQQVSLIQQFSKIAAENGIFLSSCLEDERLASCGVDVSGCLTKEKIEKALDIRLSVPERFQPPRSGCRCLLGNDIGAYQSCLHGCRYCYATDSFTLAKENYGLHEDDSPFLIGNAKEDDVVKLYPSESWIAKQMTLF